MGDWCKRQHGGVSTIARLKSTTLRKQLTASGAQSGLTDACLNSPHAHDFVKRKVLHYIKQWVPRGTGVLAGNSVHFDREFLVKEMPEVVDWLHYRCVPHNHSIFGLQFTYAGTSYRRIVGKL